MLVASNLIFSQVGRGRWGQEKGKLTTCPGLVEVGRDNWGKLRDDNL